jgi:hypothetical protein
MEARGPRRYEITPQQGSDVIAKAAEELIAQAQARVLSSLDRESVEAQWRSLWLDLGQSGTYFREAANTFADTCQRATAIDPRDVDAVLAYREHVLGQVSHQLSLLLAITGLAASIVEIPSKQTPQEGEITHVGP